METARDLIGRGNYGDFHLNDFGRASGIRPTQK